MWNVTPCRLVNGSLRRRDMLTSTRKIRKGILHEKMATRRINSGLTEDFYQAEKGYEERSL
jgi:hypothetical protein